MNAQKKRKTAQKPASQHYEMNIGSRAKVQGSVLLVGDQEGVNIVFDSKGSTFGEVYKAIDEHPKLSPQEREDVKADVKEIEAEVKKGEEADETFVARRLRNLLRMAPDIAEVAIATLANPSAGVSLAISKIAKKAGAETQKQAPAQA